MARQQLPPQIKRRVIGTDAKGREVVRYEVVVDLGAAGGRRRQTRRRFETETAARAFLNPILGDKSRGTHVAPNQLPMKTIVAKWLAAQRVEQKTLEVYTNHLRPVVEVLGDRPVQSITKDDIEALVQGLIHGTTPRGVWAATTINPMLSRLRTVFNELVAQGIVARNPAALVRNVRREDTLKKEAPTRNTFTPEQCRQLLEQVRGTEDDALVALALLGLRRGEIAGLRWSAVDAAEGVLAVTRTRATTTRGTTDRNRTKTVSSTRELALDPDDVAWAFLKDARHRQRRERLSWGSAWKGQDDGHVVCKPDGSPYNPATIQRRWDRAVKAAGLPPITLHEGRHTAATLMLQDPNTPEAEVAAWLGHKNAEVTRRVYAHSQKHKLRAAGRALTANYDPKRSAEAATGAPDAAAEFSGGVTSRDTGTDSVNGG